MTINLKNKRRELVGAWLSPLAIVLLSAINSWLELYPDPSEGFFSIWVTVVVAYPTMFFLALPAWRSESAHGSVGWVRSLSYGAAFGAVLPGLLGVFVVGGILLDRNWHDLAAVTRESIALMLLGALMGIVIALLFKIIVHHSQTDSS